MRRCRPVTVALLALLATLALAPLARAQTTSVLPGTSGTLPGSVATTTVVPPTTAAPPPSTATIQTTATPQTGQAGTSTATPASDGPGSTNDSKLPVLLLAVLGAILLAAALAIVAARWWAYDPPWLVRTRHATAEAGWRTSAAWAEFRDWLRIGR
ncbi:hypothetical protein [Conexibacter woesei]|uniref:hypothetical protein n=1 Tax=Conexibacter woesei TaxID=191495 RepID=UPI00040B5880|nr:hypothetical protein [Conexibacter woesei]